LDRALASLPSEQRDVLALKLDAGLTFEEIAAALAMSPNTAASRYRYALEKLRAFLKESDRGTG
jgi:RNA polymerase sigma-70 factor (ECF subfamily)